MVFECIFSSGEEIRNDSVFSKDVRTIKKDCEILQLMRCEVDGFVYVLHNSKQC